MNLPLLFLCSCLLLFYTDAQAAIRMGIISDALYFGEREVGWRIKRAAESLGWQVFLDEQKGESLRGVKNLDWVICLIPYNKHLKSDCANYMAVFHPFGFFDEEGYLLPFYEQYDGYLLTLAPERLKSRTKPLRSIPFFPSTQNFAYKQVSLNNLTTTIPVWSHRIKTQKHLSLYTLLSQSGFARFYGTPESQRLVQSGYMGQIPFDGISLVNTLQQHGIVLIIHSGPHNKAKIPSARIFEAAAASTVIISDDNSFVKTEFGDSVFYIDTKASSEEIYAQINHHMETIRQDPEAALRMAAKAHQIYTEHFLMTDQLLRLEAMHREIKASKAQT